MFYQYRQNPKSVPPYAVRASVPTLRVHERAPKNHNEVHPASLRSQKAQEKEYFVSYVYEPPGLAAMLTVAVDTDEASTSRTISPEYLAHPDSAAGDDDRDHHAKPGGPAHEQRQSEYPLLARCKMPQHNEWYSSPGHS